MIHSTCNSFLNFCENRVLFIREDFGECDEKRMSCYVLKDTDVQKLKVLNPEYFDNLSIAELIALGTVLKKLKDKSFGFLKEKDLKTFHNKKSPHLSLQKKSETRLETKEVTENLQAIQTFIEQYYSDIVKKYPFSWTESLPVNAVDLALTQTSICSSISELIREYLKQMNINSKLVIRNNSIHHSIVVELGEIDGKKVALLMDVNTGGESAYEKKGVRVWDWRKTPDVSEPFLIESLDDLTNINIVSTETHDEVIRGNQSFYSVKYEDSKLFFKALSEYNRAKKLQKSKNFSEAKKYFDRCVLQLKQVIERLPVGHPLVVNAQSRLKKLLEKL